MKANKLSKVLAMLLAVVMIFTALPLMAFADNESQETYVVSYSSPAILMNEMTKVNLADIYVEMDAVGTTVPGNYITWAAEKNDGISYNAVDKTITAYAKGTYKLTATYNGIVKNVYVMVKKENEDKFYLVNMPTLNSSSFVEEDWRIFSTTNNTDVTVSEAIDNGIISFASDYITLSHKYSETDNSLKKGSTIAYVDEIFKDFGDYTVEALVSSNGAATIEGVGGGVGGRITLNEKETGFTTGILSYFRQSKVATITRINNDYGPHGTAVAKDSAGKYYTWKGVNDYHTVKTVYNGNYFSFHYDSETIYEYTSTPGTCTCTNANCIFKHTIPQTGYPAIVGFGAAIRAKSFYVYLNSNELAPASAVDFYKVSYTAPAIPMNVNTAVDLNYINVEMDADGTIATAAEIVWNAPKQEGLYFNEDANRVSVYAAGTYKLTATAKGVTKNVWIVAKGVDDEKFYLVNIPTLNSSSFVESDWRIFSTMNNTDITIADALTSNLLSLGNDYVEVAHKFGEIENLKKSGTLVYADEIFKDFSDYTVEGLVASGGAQTIDGVGGGVGGRVTLNEKETGYTTGILSYIRQTKVATITRINNDFGPHGTAISKDAAGKYYTWQGLNDYHTIKTVYNGNRFSFHYDTETIYEYTSTPGTCTCTNANCIFKHTIPGAGYPALVGMGATTRFKSFYVYLNSNEMPDAIAADEMPEEEKIIIYNVESYDPVIVMHNNTSAALENITVQLQDGGKVYSATEVIWTVPATDGIAIANGEEGSISAYTNGTYIVTATVGDVSKKIYVLVTDKSKNEIVLYNDQFENHTLDYSIWQQTEYYWDTAYQVTAQKDKTGKYDEGTTISQLGAIPFVTRDYWDALYLGGPRSSADAGGTGYDSKQIFMNNTYYYAYIREDFVTADGIKLSDLGVYNVSASFETLNPGTNISKYNASSGTYGSVRNEYNGFGIMGRIDFAGESYYKKGSSTMQSFMYDSKTDLTKQLVIGLPSGNKTTVVAGGGGVNSFGIGSFNVQYRPGTVTGTYIPIRTASKDYFADASYSFTTQTDNSTGSVGFFTEGQDLDIYDFTVSYPVTVPYSVSINITADENIVTVPVNTTIDLTKYTFVIGGNEVNGGEMVWSGVRNSIGELDTINKTFTAFSVGTTSINGVTFVVSDTVSTLGTVPLADVKGNGNVTVTPDDTLNSYKISVKADNGYLLRAGVVTVKYEDGTTKTEGVDNDGEAIIIADHIGGVKIVAEFVEANELGFVSLGATVRLKTNNTTAGIKFGARINNIRLNDGKAILDSEIIIDGKQYKIAEVGSLIIPTRLLEGTELTVASKNARKKRTTMVSNLTEDYADITAVLTGIPATWYGLDISFRGYIKYTNLDGTGEYYVYTDEIERTYNGVMKSAPVSATGIEYNTDNTTVMLTSAKANIKYALGEQMIVLVDTYIDSAMANGIKLKYSIFAGDTNGYSGSAIETGTAISDSNASVKITYLAENAGYYYVVVSALDANDNVVITDTIRLGTGIVSANGTNVFDENNIALSFGVTSDTHIREVYSNSSHNKHFADVLRIVNNQAGYYSDGTQKLDAFLIAGDITNALTGNTNLNGLPKDALATTAREFDYLIYSETDMLRNMLAEGLGDAQLFYSLGNHDTTGGGRASFVNEPYTFRSTLFYQQMLSGKKVNLPNASGLTKGYDKALLFAGMSDAEIEKLHFNVNDNYTDSKDYIKYYGRDEETSQDFAYGNRVMKINGITFISLQHTILQNGFARYTDATLRFLKDALDESVANDPSAPVFIITHFRPYTTGGFHVDPVYAGAVNIGDILKDYPQAVVWGGHEHDSLQSETAIVQTRVVDSKGRVVSQGYTSLTSAASANNSDDIFDYGAKVTSSYVQLVQVDVNGNIRITKYLVDSPIAAQASLTTQGNEIVKGADGQWIKSWDTNPNEVVTRVQTINNPWYIVNAADDNVRDEYAIDTRAALSQPEFVNNNITVSGNTVTFPKAINALGIVNENTYVFTYRACLYDENGNLVETKVISQGPQRYNSYSAIPTSDTYSVTFSGTGAKVVITAFDVWAAYIDHAKYPTLIVNL